MNTDASSGNQSTPPDAGLAEPDATPGSDAEPAALDAEVPDAAMAEPQCAQITYYHDDLRWAPGPPMGFMDDRLLFSVQDDEGRWQLGTEVGELLPFSPNQAVLMGSGGGGLGFALVNADGSWMISHAVDGTLMPVSGLQPVPLDFAPGQTWQAGPDFVAWTHAGFASRWDADIGEQTLGDGRVLDAHADGTLVFDSLMQLVLHGQDGSAFTVDIGLPLVDAAFNSVGQYWVEPGDGALWRTNRSRIREQLGEGCAHLSVVNDRMVAVCDRYIRRGTLVEGPALISEAPSAPGSQARSIQNQLVLEDGAHIAAVATDGTAVAWAQFDDEVDWCNGSEGGGRLRYTPSLGGGTTISELDRLDAGCMCCDSFWPEMWLGFSPSGDALAWSYAVSDAGKQAAQAVKAAKAQFCP